jgi:hypothetical protein
MHSNDVRVVQREQEISFTEDVPLFVHLAGLHDIDCLDSYEFICCLIESEVHLAEGTFTQALQQFVVLKFG